MASWGRLGSQKSPQEEPYLTWNGKRRLFCCAFYVSLRFSISFCFFLFLFACVIAPLASLAALARSLRLSNSYVVSWCLSLVLSCLLVLSLHLSNGYVVSRCLFSDPKPIENPPQKPPKSNLKILPKNLQNPPQKPPKSTPKGASFRDHLERRFGTDFCPNCAASWGVLEAVLGASWGVLGASWGVLGVFRGVFGASWRHLGLSRVRLGRSWARLGCLLARLGRIFAFCIDFSMFFIDFSLKNVPPN